MPQITMDIEVWCGGCGEGICHLAVGRRRPGEIDVSPCAICLERAKTEAYDYGFDKGYKQHKEEMGL